MKACGSPKNQTKSWAIQGDFDCWKDPSGNLDGQVNKTQLILVCRASPLNRPILSKRQGGRLPKSRDSGVRGALRIRHLHPPIAKSPNSDPAAGGFRSGTSFLVFLNSSGFCETLLAAIVGLQSFSSQTQPSPLSTSPVWSIRNPRP